MTARVLNRLIALILAAALFALGVAAASARGQTTAGGQVLVFCSADGLVQATIDAEGQPTGGKHLCPELAAGLLGAAALAAPGVPAPMAMLLAEAHPPVLALCPKAVRAAPRARGPPIAV